ncbi:peptide-methionine (R)-S-oxide reductase [Actinopolyspora alba]|uniref:peptide-methionine (R)-S-oxide reductase n=2 Tax=Actinopolyspora alba TaxID=673379 RepID=A0A1I1XG56_9ACTN|nr:peptide-methionine (R)-S-oxide reductase [Actinopolyspora alba]
MERASSGAAALARNYRGGMDPVVGSTPKVVKSEQQWRERLDQDEYAVLRQGATEAPYSGDYVEEKTQGVYECRACGAELFRSGTKFESHCGWPSFWDPSDSEAVLLREDRSHGMVRVEVLCASCHSHLGHVFEGEGYPTPTDQRYCINSIALRLEPDENA